MAVNWPTSASLQGGRDISRIHSHAVQEDLGFKVEQLICNVNDLILHVSTLQVVVKDVVSSMSTAAGASAFLLTASATGITSIANLSGMSAAVMSNFRS